MIEKNGIVLSGFKTFGDHNRYAKADVDTIETEARSCDANSLLTTAKDAVKLTGLQFNLPVFVVEIKPKIDEIDRFEKIITFS